MGVDVHVVPIPVDIDVVDISPASVPRPPPRRTPPAVVRGEAERESGGQPASKPGAKPVSERRPDPDIRPDKWRIPEPGPEDHDPFRRKARAVVAWRVTRVDDVRSGPVNIDVRRVINRAARRDRVDRGRHGVRHRPRPGRRMGHKPHAVDDRVESILGDLHNRRGRVDSIRERRSFNRLELGVSGIADLGRRAPRNRGGLRDRRGNRRLPRLGGSGHRCEHRPGRIALRDVCEIRRKLSGRHVLPGAGQRRGREPPPGNHHVVSLARDIDKNRAAGIGHPQELRPRDRRKLRHALRGDQFGGPGAHKNRRRQRGLRALGRIEKLGGGRDVLERGGQRSRRVLRGRPRAGQRRCLRPPTIDPQIVNPARLVHDEQGLGVDRAQELGSRHRAECGIAVHQHQHGGGLAEKDCRHRVLHGHSRFAFRARNREIRADRGKREVLRPCSGLRADQTGVIGGLVRGGRKIGLRRVDV